LAKFHKHLIIRAEINAPAVDPTYISETWMPNLINRIGMKTLMGPYATYCDVPGNRGLTAVTIIETSHIAMHIWDEEKPAFVQFDLYTCSTLPVNKVINKLENDLGLFDHTSLVLERSNGFNILSPEKWKEIG
jgi:S-adenosylmethionine/arginine decarboxylase-like enzyme